MQTATNADAVIDIRGLNTRFGDAVVHENVSLDVRRGEFSRWSGRAAAASRLCCAKP